MDTLTAPVPTVADRLMQLGARLRERAVAQGTFDRETAETVEELARIAAVVTRVYAVLHDLDISLETMRRSVGRF